MTICFVTPEFISEPENFDGGLSNYLYRVSLGLLQLGHKPIVIVASDRMEVITHRNIEVHRVNCSCNFADDAVNWLFQSYELNNYLANLTNIGDIDIIQYSSYRGTGYYRINNKPCVARISSYTPLYVKYYNHNLEYAAKQAEIEISAIKNCDAIFGPCKLIAKEIERKENLTVQIIESPYLFESGSLDDKYLKQFNNTRYLLFFGTIGLLKGVKTIADILNELFYNNKDLKFVFIGKDAGYNEGQMIDYVIEKAGRFKDNIVHFDRMGHEQLFPIIKRSLGVILPSRIDNFPNTCIEALAQGAIVVGTKNTGFEQLITDGVNGFLCEKDDPLSLLNTIQQVIDLDEVQRKRLQLNARKRIDLLKPEIVVEELVSFYNSVIRKHSDFLIVKNRFGVGDRILWDNMIRMDEKLKNNRKLISKFNKRNKLIYNPVFLILYKTIKKTLNYFQNIPGKK